MAQKLTVLNPDPPPSPGKLTVLNPGTSNVTPDPETPWYRPVIDFVSQLQSLNPIAIGKGAYQIATDLPGTVSAIGQENLRLFGEAERSFKAGDYATGTRKILSYLMSGIPGLGSRLDEAATAFQSGEVAQGLGMTADAALGLPGYSLGGKTIPSPLKKTVAGSAAGALGVPTDAATATGSRVVRGVQGIADRTILGDVVASHARARTAGALTAAGERIAGAIYPSPILPDQVGESVRAALEARASRDAAARAKAGIKLSEKVSTASATPETAGATLIKLLENKITTLHGEADQAYGRLRELEALPDNAQTIQVGVERTVSPIMGADGKPIISETPILETIAFPVDVSRVKRALSDLYEQLKQEASIVPPQGSRARAITALTRLMHGPDLAPLSHVDAALSDLKSVARLSDSQVSRNAGQGIAAKAVSDLELAVQAVAEKAGPEVKQALQTGRARTRAKYQTIDVLKGIQEEPVKAFSQATLAQDAGIKHLREIEREVPQALPVLGRAYVDSLLKLEPGAALSAWEKMGPQTRNLLIRDKGVQTALSAFFKPASGGSAAEVLKSLPSEPVKILSQTTYAQDAGVGKLQSIARLLPDEMPKIGRAYVDDLIHRVDAGDVSGAVRGWAKLGPQTKRLIFSDPQHVRNLDKFFLVAQNLGKDPSALSRAVLSLTQAGLILIDPLRMATLQGEAAGGALSKLLHSPTGVKLLTTGLTLPSKNTMAATLWANQVAAQLGEE